VEEFAMLSAMVARRLALAASPATPAFSEEEMVMDAPFCCVDLFDDSHRAAGLTAA
jgi:hypothetical protein